MVKPAPRKEVAGYLLDRYGLSTRKAAQNSWIACATMYYKKESRQRVQRLRMAIRDSASKRPRFGWRRILVLVRSDGYQVGEIRLLRPHREERLSSWQKLPKSGVALSFVNQSRWLRRRTRSGAWIACTTGSTVAASRKHFKTSAFSRSAELTR